MRLLRAGASVERQQAALERGCDREGSQRLALGVGLGQHCKRARAQRLAVEAAIRGAR